MHEIDIEFLMTFFNPLNLFYLYSHPSMFADPDFAESTIEEHKFTLMDGVVGLAFDVESRTVYFQPLATDR